MMTERCHGVAARLLSLPDRVLWLHDLALRRHGSVMVLLRRHGPETGC